MAGRKANESRKIKLRPNCEVYKVVFFKYKFACLIPRFSNVKIMIIMYIASSPKMLTLGDGKIGVSGERMEQRRVWEG